MKILCTIKDFQAKEELEKLGEVMYKETTFKEDIMVCGLNILMDKRFLEFYPNLKILATMTTGTDHIDLEYCKKRNIKVLKLDGEDMKESTGVAELTFALMIMLLRKIPQAIDDVKAGNWSRESFMGESLRGKTLGVVGWGRIGQQVIGHGVSFGMKLLVNDKKNSPNSFEQILEESDIISIHCPLNEETKGMFGEKEFKKMKNSAILINTSRGEIVDEEALISALGTEQIAGYGSDFFGKEKQWSSILLYENVIITPHIGGMTKEGHKIAAKVIVSKLKKEL